MEHTLTATGVPCHRPLYTSPYSPTPREGPSERLSGQMSQSWAVEVCGRCSGFGSWDCREYVLCLHSMDMHVAKPMIVHARARRLREIQAILGGIR